MRKSTLILASAFALSTSLAFAQSAGSTAGGSSAAGDPAASKTTTGDSMNGSTTGGGPAMKNGTAGPAAQSTMPLGKDASTQGANTAGSAEKKGRRHFARRDNEEVDETGRSSRPALLFVRQK